MKNSNRLLKFSQALKRAGLKAEAEIARHIYRMAQMEEIDAIEALDDDIEEEVSQKDWDREPTDEELMSIDEEGDPEDDWDLSEGTDFPETSDEESFEDDPADNLINKEMPWPEEKSSPGNSRSDAVQTATSILDRLKSKEPASLSAEEKYVLEQMEGLIQDLQQEYFGDDFTETNKEPLAWGGSMELGDADISSARLPRAEASKRNERRKKV